VPAEKASLFLCPFADKLQAKGSEKDFPGPGALQLQGAWQQCYYTSSDF